MNVSRQPAVEHEPAAAGGVAEAEQTGVQRLAGKCSDPSPNRTAARDIASGARPVNRIAAFPRQALHARLLGFTHPAGRGRLSFTSPLPADLCELVGNLELL